MEAVYSAEVNLCHTTRHHMSWGCTAHGDRCESLKYEISLCVHNIQPVAPFPEQDESAHIFTNYFRYILILSYIHIFKMKYCA